MPSNLIKPLTHLSPSELYGWLKHSLRRDYILRVKVVIFKHAEKEYERDHLFLLFFV